MNRDPIEELQKFYAGLSEVEVPDLPIPRARLTAWTIPAGLGLGVAATLAVALIVPAAPGAEAEGQQAARVLLNRQMQAYSEPAPNQAKAKKGGKKWPSQA